MFGETLVYLVFDESDELSMPSTMRSSAWNVRAVRSFFADTGYAFGPDMSDIVGCHHLFGHYYVIYLDY
jgi:hypothetical protein